MQAILIPLISVISLVIGIIIGASIAGIALTKRIKDGYIHIKQHKDGKWEIIDPKSL